MNIAITSFRQPTTRNGAQAASPHELIDRLLDGARSRLRRARGCIREGDAAGRSRAIGATTAILQGLQASLDHDRGGELAGNLDALYDYMQRRLIRADAGADAGGVDEVLGLVITLQEAWGAIGDQVPQRLQA